MAKMDQGYLDREAESVGERNRAETEDERIRRLAGVKGVQTSRDRARESRGMRRKEDGPKGEYGFGNK